MKKIYNAPLCDIEGFTARDVITMSVISTLSSFDDGMDISNLDWSE